MSLGAVLGPLNRNQIGQHMVGPDRTEVKVGHVRMPYVDSLAEVSANASGG